MEEVIKKEPHLAKGMARIDSRRETDSLNIQDKGSLSNTEVIQKDAKVLQFLKEECQRTDTGATTLEEVFTGLLSVHNQQLAAFADALEMEAD